MSRIRKTVRRLTQAASSALAPTIETLVAKGAKVIVMSHFGRPKGPDPSQSLRPLIEPLSHGIGAKAVHFAADCIGPEAERVVAALKPGEVALLENLRFQPEEEKNDPFSRDSWRRSATCMSMQRSRRHRAQPSIEALAHLLPAAAGKNMQTELEALGAALESPPGPVIALIGGAKGKVEKLAIGGAMASTFLFAQGQPIGRSLCERGR